MEQTSKLTYRTTISAVVHRADGTVEDLGIIADSNNNTVEVDQSLLKRIWRKLKHG